VNAGFRKPYEVDPQGLKRALPINRKKQRQGFSFSHFVLYPASMKYKPGDLITFEDRKGTVVENVKLPNDICVLWDTGEFSSYDEWFLDRYMKHIPMESEKETVDANHHKNLDINLKCLHESSRLFEGRSQATPRKMDWARRSVRPPLRLLER
jgi:hypothetical protein